MGEEIAKDKVEHEKEEKADQGWGQSHLSSSLQTTEIHDDDGDCEKYNDGEDEKCPWNIFESLPFNKRQAWFWFNTIDTIESESSLSSTQDRSHQVWGGEKNDVEIQICILIISKSLTTVWKI